MIIIHLMDDLQRINVLEAEVEFKFVIYHSLFNIHYSKIIEQ